MNKPVDDGQTTFSIATICGFLKTGLEHLDTFQDNVKNVNVKQITLMNEDTLLCEFYPLGLHSFEVKQEMAVIMSFLSAFFKDDPYEGIYFRYFASRALDQQEDELMYSVSSRASAATISNGNSIEWLRTTLFQENTHDYRLSRAKTIISDIENAIRTVIKKILFKKFGLDWWNMGIDKTFGDPVKRIYANQFGDSVEDGELLVNYTFTLDLKKIISADWGRFKHLFDKKTAFEAAMVELNVIRREEAHNRPISRQHLDDLDRLYKELLYGIEVHYPDTVLSYLAENWKTKIAAIFTVQPKITYTLEEFSVLDDEGKRLLIIKDCRQQIEYLENQLTKLNSLIVPVSKSVKHKEMTDLLVGYKILQEQKLNCALNRTWEEVSTIVANIELQGQKMNVFSKQLLLEES
jgi:hypothetical protein